MGMVDQAALERGESRSEDFGKLLSTERKISGVTSKLWESSIRPCDSFFMGHFY
jgi:hypothetical protein